MIDIETQEEQLLYHYAPKLAPVMKEGLKTPHALLGSEFEKNFLFYASRAARYHKKAIKNTTCPDIIQYLEFFRGSGGSRVISVLSKPLFRPKDRKRRCWLKDKDLYSFDFLKLLKEGIVEKTMLVAVQNKPMFEIDIYDFYKTLKESENDIPQKSGHLIFQNYPHGYIVLKDGIIYRELICKVIPL